MFIFVVNGEVFESGLNLIRHIACAVPRCTDLFQYLQGRKFPHIDEGLLYFYEYIRVHQRGGASP